MQWGVKQNSFCGFKNAGIKHGSSKARLWNTTSAKSNSRSRGSCGELFASAVDNTGSTGWSRTPPGDRGREYCSNSYAELSNRLFSRELLSFSAKRGRVFRRVGV